MSMIPLYSTFKNRTRKSLTKRGRILNSTNQDPTILLKYLNQIKNANYFKSAVNKMTVDIESENSLRKRNNRYTVKQQRCIDSE